MNNLKLALNRISNALARRQLVGKDGAGNSYYKKLETDFSGTTFERRTMVPGDRSAAR